MLKNLNTFSHEEFTFASFPCDCVEFLVKRPSPSYLVQCIEHLLSDVLKCIFSIFSQLERLDQVFEEEPFLLLAGIKCTSPWPVTMVNTTLNMVSLFTYPSTAGRRRSRTRLVCPTLQLVVREFCCNYSLTRPSFIRWKLHPYVKPHD